MRSRDVADALNNLLAHHGGCAAGRLPRP